MRSLRALLPLTVVVVCGACGASTPDAFGTGGRSSPADAALPPVDEVAVRAGVRQRMNTQLAAIAIADADAYAAGVTEDALIIGTAAGDVVIGRAALVAAMTRDYEPLTRVGATFEATSRELVIGVGPDGQSAWAYDTIDFAVVRGGTRLTYVYQVSAVLTRQPDGAWLIVAQKSAIPFDHDEPNASRLPALEASIGPGADAVVALLPEQARPLRDQVIDPSMRGVAMMPTGAVRAALLPGGRVGWLVTGVDLMGEDMSLRGRLHGRLLLVAVRDAGGAWKIVQAHPSVAREAD